MIKLQFALISPLFDWMCCKRRYHFSILYVYKVVHIWYDSWFCKHDCQLFLYAWKTTQKKGTHCLKICRYKNFSSGKWGNFVCSRDVWHCEMKWFTKFVSLLLNVIKGGWLFRIILRINIYEQCLKNMFINVMNSISIWLYSLLFIDLFHYIFLF